MLLISRHLTEYNIDIPEDAVIRINLAWEDDRGKLDYHLDNLIHDVFVDIPTGRTKPPATNWTLETVGQLCDEFNCIKYVAASNVENDEVIYKYRHFLPHAVTIVPKIESVIGCENATTTISALPTNTKRTIMIDHDDLFVDIMNRKLPPKSLYNEYILPLCNWCAQNDVRVLRTAGIVFADH